MAIVFLYHAPIKIGKRLLKTAGLIYLRCAGNGDDPGSGAGGWAVERTGNRPDGFGGTDCPKKAVAPTAMEGPIAETIEIAGRLPSPASGTSADRGTESGGHRFLAADSGGHPQQNRW